MCTENQDKVINKTLSKPKMCMHEHCLQCYWWSWVNFFLTGSTFYSLSLPCATWSFQCFSKCVHYWHWPVRQGDYEGTAQGNTSIFRKMAVNDKKLLYIYIYRSDFPQRSDFYFFWHSSTVNNYLLFQLSLFQLKYSKQNIKNHKKHRTFHRLKLVKEL